MEETKLTAKESLEVITSMINRTQQRFMLGEGNILLMWGYLSVCITALALILIYSTMNMGWIKLVWLIWAVGAIATPVIIKKKRTDSGVKSYTDTLVSQIWSFVGVAAIVMAIICIIFFIMKIIDSWSLMIAFGLIFLAFGEIANGIVIREKSLIYGASVGLLTAVCSICILASHVYSALYIPFVYIFAFICMMIIPGHILNHKSRKNS